MNECSLKNLCMFDDCKNLALYGEKDCNAFWCYRHKKKNTFNVNYKLCFNDGCLVRARYGYIHEDKLFCSIFF